MTANPDKYLQYLDKEMTIMGVVSAFAVALAALVTDHFFAANGGGAAGSGSVYACIMAIPLAKFCVLLGGVSSLVAAVCFYLQRSLLAWYYGQLALEASLSPPNAEADKFLIELDGWDTWLRYQTGCTILAWSFGCYVCAILEWSIPVLSYQGRIRSGIFAALLGILVLIVIVLRVRWHVLSFYWHKPDAYAAWSKECKGCVRKSVVGFIFCLCQLFEPPTQVKPNRLNRLVGKKRVSKPQERAT